MVAIGQDIGLPSFVRVGFEGQGAGQHRIKGHSQRPDVSQLSIITDLFDDFWRGVGRSPTDSLPKGISLTAEAEVNKFDVPMVIEEYVLWFDVSVTDAVFLEIDEG